MTATEQKPYDTPKDWPDGMKRALFLDRDGVVNVDTGYVHRPEQVTFVDGIFELCRLFQSRDFLPIVVTNQAGIARGIYTEDDFQRLCDWMRGVFGAGQISLAGIYHCPHHPECGQGQYRQVCRCRKPGPELFLRAARDHDLDLRNCVSIGDKPADIVAGINAGVGFNILIASQYTDGQSHPGANLMARSVRDLVSALTLLDRIL